MNLSGLHSVHRWEANYKGLYVLGYWLFRRTKTGGRGLHMLKRLIYFDVGPVLIEYIYVYTMYLLVLNWDKLEKGFRRKKGIYKKLTLIKP